jgi:DNA-binding CsgD family transcriptional regulator
MPVLNGTGDGQSIFRRWIRLLSRGKQLSTHLYGNRIKRMLVTISLTSASLVGAVMLLFFHRHSIELQVWLSLLMVLCTELFFVSISLWTIVDIFTKYRNGIEGNLKRFLLTVREKEILRLLRKGLSNRRIAEVLFISPLTVKRHVYNIFRKVSVKSRMELIDKVTWRVTGSL